MQILSAVDAISPAWEHTRRLLFARRDWRLLLKIGTVAVFAEMGGCNGSFNGVGNHMPSQSSAVVAAIFAFAVLIGIAAFFIGLGFFYLSSRLQFVLFDVVLRSDTTVAPIWKRFGRVTWRWMGLKLLFIFGALICLAPLLIPAGIRLFHMMSQAQQSDGQMADPASFFLSIFGFILCIFVLALIFSICYILLRDFALPSLALEDTTIGVAVRRVVGLVRREPGQAALYVLMSFLLKMAGAMVSYVALLIVALIALVPLGGGGLALWFGLRHGSTGGHVLMVAGWVVLGLIFLAVMIVAFIMVFGYMFTFMQAYTLYFLGGRYPMLGAYLEPHMPPVPPSHYGYPPPPMQAEPDA